MQNIFSNFYVLSILLTLVQCRIISIVMTRTGFSQMKPRIYRHNFLNRQLGRTTTAEGVSKQNSHPFKVMQK